MKLIKANKDPQVLIKEIDQNCYHVEHTRISPDATGRHPEINKRIIPYIPKEYDQIFGKNGFVEKHGLGAMNDDEVRVVHDPRYAEELEQKRNDAEAKRLRDVAAKKKKELADKKEKPGVGNK